MKTQCIRLFALFLLAVLGPALSASAQAEDHYEVTDAIYDEAGLKLNLHLQYETPATATVSRAEQAGQWYLLDFIKLPPDQAEKYRNHRRTWNRDHALCAVEDAPGGWYLFRVDEPRSLAGVYDFVTATPIPGEWHEWSQVEYLPTELFTHLPPALELLLAQSIGYRELRWVQACPPGKGCRRLAAKK